MITTKEQLEARPVVTTLSEIEGIAVSHPEYQGVEGPMYSRDGQEWDPFWLGEEPPALARFTVAREGRTATTVYVDWRTSLPEDEEARERWLAAPAQMLGARARRLALMQAFRDCMRVEAEDPQMMGEPAPARDWEAEVKEAESVADLARVWYEAGQSRARTGALERAYRARVEALGGEVAPGVLLGPRRERASAPAGPEGSEEK